MFKQKYSRRTVLLCCLLSLVTAFGIPAWLSTNTPEFGDNARRSLWKINDILMRTFSPSALANVGWLSTSAPERGDDENRSLQKINDILNTSVGAGALPISVKAFGAKGDGSTDDTTAIQAALTYASANGVNVYFPATSTYYKLTTQLIGYDNTTIYGDGYYSQVRQTGSGNSGKNVMIFTGKTNFVVRALHIKSNGEYTPGISDYGASYNGITIRDCKDGIIEDCVFTSCAVWSIFNYVSDRMIFRRNQFPDPGGPGDPMTVQMQTTAIFSSDSSGCRIEDNKIWKNADNAWVNGIGVYQGITNSHIFSRDNTVSRNTIKDCSQYGVLSYCTDGSKLFRTVVENNTFENIDGSYHAPAAGTDPAGFNTGTAAGTAVYMQNSLASRVSHNVIYNCNLFSRERGSLIKAGISGSGSPDLMVDNNKVENCYHNGIYFNNSGLFGDYTNSIPMISANHVINCGTFINLGSITAGSTNLTLANMTLPLQQVMSNYMAGGFIEADKITITGAGVAGAAFETTIYKITNGIVMLLTSASTTVSSKGVVLSELGDTPPSINYGIKAAYVDRVSIVGNAVMLHDTNDLSVVAVTRSKGIGVLGTADGVNELILPNVADNEIHGGYYGIELSGTRLANVTGNSLNDNAQTAIVANNATLFGRFNQNSIRASAIGMLINSLNGVVSGNNFRSVTTGITSSGARLSMNNFSGVTTEYGTDTPQQAAYASGTVYTLTATPALVDFGTTDPAITIPAGGAFVLTGGLNVKYVGATYAANQTCTVKLRKTSGTAADVTSATRTITLRIVTTITDDAGYVTIPPTVFNATAGDVIQVWASVSATPSAGSVTVDSAEILATPL